MTDSDKLRIERGRIQIRELKASSARRVLIDVSGMDIQGGCDVLHGTRLEQLGVAWRFLLSVLLYPCPFSALRVRVFRRMGMKIGRNVYISPGAYLDTVHPQLITLGDNVIVGMGAVLTTHTRSRTTLSVGRIDVGDDVIIGGMALVREGLRIGAGAEIDATLHLTRNVRPGEKLVAPRNGTSVRVPE
jgi:hypothetical protein